MCLGQACVATRPSVCEEGHHVHGREIVCECWMHQVAMFCSRACGRQTARCDGHACVMRRVCEVSHRD